MSSISPLRKFIKTQVPQPMLNSVKFHSWRARHHLRFLLKPNWPLGEVAKAFNLLAPDLKLGPGSTVLDLGAHEGWFTEFCAKRGATVLAVEPNPWLWNRGAKRLAKYSNVTYICAAVGHGFGLRNLYFPEGYRRAPELYCGSASLMNDSSEVDEGVRLTVPVVDIDELLDTLGEVTLLKCDIEGAEAEIWPSIRNRANQIKWLMMETHEYYLPNIGVWKEDALAFITTSSRQDKWSLEWP